MPRHTPPLASAARSATDAAGALPAPATTTPPRFDGLTHALVEALRPMLEEVVRRAVRQELSGAPMPLRRLYLEAQDIADHYRVSRALVHRWTRDHGCPHSSHGGVIRYELDAVEAWFRRREK